MTDQRFKPENVTFRSGHDGIYTVYWDYDFIGRVARDGKRWKATDAYMAWMQRYNTRRAAGEGLLRHWRKVTA